MKLAWFIVGILLIVFGGYPPFSLWVVLVGLALTIYGLLAQKNKK